MNFEYKVGYLWKSPDEDPGQQKTETEKWQTNRSDGCPKPPERIVRYFACRREKSIQIVWRYFGKLLTCLRPPRVRIQPWIFHFQPFLLFFLFLSLYLIFSQVFKGKRAVPFWFKGLRVSGLKKFCLEKCLEGPGLQRTSFGIQIPRILLKYSANFW